jgi:hypothetical protein
MFIEISSAQQHRTGLPGVWSPKQPDTCRKTTKSNQIKAENNQKEPNFLLVLEE